MFLDERKVAVNQEGVEVGVERLAISNLMPDPEYSSSTFKDTHTAQTSFLRSFRKSALSPG